MVNRFAIITACDSKYGDFLVDHWLKSLKENNNLTGIDIIVLDYGLNDAQRKILSKDKIKLVLCKKDGNITNIRYRDMKIFLLKNKYEQILSCDSGDIIFQDSIVELFNMNKNNIRIVKENLKYPLFVKKILKNNSIKSDIEKEILNRDIKYTMCNGGFVLGPYEKFIDLCNFIWSSIQKPEVFALDQILLNNYAYKKGCIELPERFNFIPRMSLKKFSIKEGTFFDFENKQFAVVHNLGGNNLFRVISNFGYGRKFNKLNKFKYIVGKGYSRVNNWLF